MGSGMRIPVLGYAHPWARVTRLGDPVTSNTAMYPHRREMKQVKILKLFSYHSHLSIATRVKTQLDQDGT
jgi:hypothetical protein